jgi:hypothetical protein
MKIETAMAAKPWLAWQEMAAAGSKKSASESCHVALARSCEAAPWLVAESVMKLPTTLRRAITARYGNEKAPARWRKLMAKTQRR